MWRLNDCIAYNCSLSIVLGVIPLFLEASICAMMFLVNIKVCEVKCCNCNAIYGMIKSICLTYLLIIISDWNFTNTFFIIIRKNLTKVYIEIISERLHQPIIIYLNGNLFPSNRYIKKSHNLVEKVFILMFIMYFT